MAEGEMAGRDGDAILAELIHWQGVLGEAQMLVMERGGAIGLKVLDDMGVAMGASQPTPTPGAAAHEVWGPALDLLRGLLPAGGGDRRFAAPEWQQPLYDLVQRTYAAVAATLIERTEAAEGLDDRAAAQLRFATRALVDAASPSNFAATNPQVLARTLETRGRNLLVGLERMLDDLREGKLRHVGKDSFEIGRNIATTPGKVILETPLFQLIHYAPTTPDVQATPLIIFPPWINRFYILDLSPAKSFVRWAVEQGISVFLVSWKSADATMAEVTMDDYVIDGEWAAIEAVTRLLDVPSAHVLGYCVAGTALAMLLAWAAAEGKADRIASATFFTAQVDFSGAGDLGLFVDDAQLAMVDGIAKDGVIDGRYLAATFNLLRGRDLIWNTVVDHYLLGEEYRPFDMLHWNGDVTNLPAGWHRRYLAELYRDNLLVKAGALTVQGTPIDLTRVATPAYVQAGREDHIAPPESVWKMTHHLTGPLRFILAGSGHIAGVVNPPAAGKYGYRTNEAPAATLDEFVAGATEHAGSWWPDWAGWIAGRSGGTVPAAGARIPGGGMLPAIEDAPGRYVRTR